MRARITALLFLACPALAAGQGFEGTVSMRAAAGFGGAGSETTMKMAVKGDLRAVTMQLPNDPALGPLAGVEMRMISDTKTGKNTTVAPMPAQLAAMIPGASGAKWFKVSANANPASMMTTPQADHPMGAKALGTSQTVAGYKCDDYEMAPDGQAPMRACVTTALGSFGLPSMANGMDGGQSGAPDWTRAFGNKPMFPLKIWSPSDGKVILEVISVEKGSIPSTTFVIPDDAFDMTSMMGGRGGGR